MQSFLTISGIITFGLGALLTIASLSSPATQMLLAMLIAVSGLVLMGIGSIIARMPSPSHDKAPEQVEPHQE